MFYMGLEDIVALEMICAGRPPFWQELYILLGFYISSYTVQMSIS